MNSPFHTIKRRSSRSGYGLRRKWQHLQLGGRPAQERRDDEQLVGRLRREGRLGARSLGASGGQLQLTPACDGPAADDAALGDEERLPQPVVDVRGEQVQPLELASGSDTIESMLSARRNIYREINTQNT